MACSGTVATYGQATDVAVATGVATAIGRIGALVAGVREIATPLTRKLDQFARRITVFIVIGAALTFLFGYTVHHFPAIEIFLTVVGLIALQLAFTCAPPLQALFRTTPAGCRGAGPILALGLAKFLAVEADRVLLRRFGVQRL